MYITSLSSAAEGCAATWTDECFCKPAGRVQVARNDPKGDSPDKGAEQRWCASQQSEESRLVASLWQWDTGRLTGSQMRVCPHKTGNIEM